MISLSDFRAIGRERWRVQRNPLVRAFTWLWGPVGLHSRIRAGHTLKRILRQELPPGAQVLDAGCGHGLVLFQLAARRPDLRLHGIEIDPELVAGCRALAERLGLRAATFERGDLSQLESVGGPYDLIFSIDVLEHIVDDAGVLRRLRRALKPEGRLVLHLPLRHQLQRRIFPAFETHTVADHVRDEYTPEEIRERLEAAGFRVLEQGYGFGPAGELAFELNTLFWTVPPLRALAALVTYPLAWLLAWADVRSEPRPGNSLLAVAGPAREVG